jgi:hypothetical protein
MKGTEWNGTEIRVWWQVVQAEGVGLGVASIGSRLESLESRLNSRVIGKHINALKSAICGHCTDRGKVTNAGDQISQRKSENEGSLQESGKIRHIRT